MLNVGPLDAENIMSDIKWTKTYEVTVNARVFRLLVFEHEGVGFGASCVWYENGRVLKAVGQPGALKVHLEQRNGTSEEAALSELLLWLRSKFEHVSELKHVAG